MAINTSTQFQADIRNHLSREVLPLAQRYLVVYQAADKESLDKRMGTSWTATRFNRLPLPFAPLAEAVAAPGQSIGLTQVTGTALQWGDKVTVSDVAELTIEHSLVKQSKRLLGMQMGELKERNTFNQLVGGTQVNYVNSRGARASLVAGDVLDPTTVQRTVSNMSNLGAPMFNGRSGEDIKRDINHGARASKADAMSHEHYLAVGSEFPLSDLAANATVVQAWSYSDVTRLYINEMGYWRGMHFCKSNMIPTWVGVAAINGTAGTVGNLATNTYYVQVTGWDTQNQYESRIYQVSTSVSVTGPNGSISVATPSTSGFTYAVYVGTTTSPANLGLSTSGPVSGPYAGQAIQIPPSTTAIITGVGLFQTPPAAPGTAVTVFPTFVFGQGAFAVLKLESVEWITLFGPDKFDTFNQQRVTAYKFFEGCVIKNNQFMCRIESTASNTGTFT